MRHNFERYGLLDDRVRFLEGWFKDTLPTAPIERLSLMRLDGDMYESTMQAIEALYPKLSPGGFCIVDDYGSYDPCRPGRSTTTAPSTASTSRSRRSTPTAPTGGRRAEAPLPQAVAGTTAVPVRSRRTWSQKAMNHSRVTNTCPTASHQ